MAHPRLTDKCPEVWDSSKCPVCDRTLLESGLCPKARRMVVRRVLRDILIVASVVAGSIVAGFIVGALIKAMR